MSESRLVSIVISNYNYGHFLVEAIDSALHQTYANREVVVVDDGSTDNSRSVIASYGSRIIPVLKENGGMASTQNAGFVASQGDVVLFLDSDDMLLPGTVAQAVPHFADPTVVRVQWPMWEVDRQGQKTGQRIPARELLEGDLSDRLIAEGPDACLGPPTSGNAWSRGFLQAVLPIPEAQFRRHSDTYLITLAPLHGRIRAIHEPAGLYRVHGNNDYACRPVDEKNQRNLEIYDLRCDLLAEQLRKQGVPARPDLWKKGAGYQWMRRRHEATEAIKALVPEGGSFILVDDQQWSDRWARGEVVTARRTIPFLERDGQYWGQPADDQTAVRELERLRGAGASCIAFAWPAFWWLDHYSGLHEHLRLRYPCVIRGENLVVFDLRK